MIRYSNLQKARDDAMWLSFRGRTTSSSFGVVPSSTDGYLVVRTDHPSFEPEEFEVLPKDHANLTYKEIQQFRMDENPLKHWEELAGAFSVMDGELLRYILHAKIPLGKLIRYELASRGFDENHQWCGFDTARDIWLK